MKHLIHTLVVLAWISLAATVCIAQDTEITRDKYYKTFRETLAKSAELSRRHVQKIKFNAKGKLREEEWTYEYQVPGRVRYIHIENVDGNVRRTEEISIGEIKYCKRDAGPWTVTGSHCIGGGSGSGIAGEIESVFRREKSMLNGVATVRYRESVTYRNTFSNTPESDEPSFMESNFWVDKNGLIVRSETRRGSVRAPSSRSETIETYEYDPKITVEAPIK
jgi:hypothetical protein